MSADVQVHIPSLADWKYEQYATCEEAATALYGVLCDICRAQGDDPAKEVFMRSPEENLVHGTGDRAWYVSYESHPDYEWAIELDASGPWGHVEPNEAFDLLFIAWDDEEREDDEGDDDDDE